MRFKAAAGWNQTETDWQNVLRLAPDLSFGMESDGTLAATTTAVCYGRRLAWLGMVLTDPAYRRHGYARRLVEHTLEALETRGIEWIKLDATEMGAPLYRQLGFQDESHIERWRGISQGGAPSTCSTAWPAGCGDLDRSAFGADRSQLLALLAPMGCAAVPGEGYAMVRSGSGAAYFGPCVSRSPETARALLTWFLSRHAPQPVCLDLLPDNTEAVRLARAAGFEPVRRLVRMVRRGVPGAAPLVHDNAQVFGTAGFEYG
jgi:GNAT superfamily N-acetyltransferase